MPIEFARPRFECVYCVMGFSSYEEAAKHEVRCRSNPEVRSCATCKHFSLHGGPEHLQPYYRDWPDRRTPHYPTMRCAVARNRCRVRTDCAEWEMRGKRGK